MTHLKHLVALGLAAGFLCAQGTSPPPGGSAPESGAKPRRTPDVSYVPSTPEAVDAMLDLGKITHRDVVYDLGCGDGRIVIAAAKKAGARGVGIDIDPARIHEATSNAKAAGVEKRLEFIEADLFEADIHDATAVVLFLAPELNLQLLPKLLHELKPGTRIISNSFDMGDWKPLKEAIVGDPSDRTHPFNHHLYMWVVPARPATEKDQRTRRRL